MNGSALASLLTTLAALAFVLALAWLSLRLLRRMQGRQGLPHGAGAPRVLHVLSLGPRERLVSVEYGGRRLLLGVTPSSIQLLDSAPCTPPGGDAAPDDATPAAAAPQQGAP